MKNDQSVLDPDRAVKRSISLPLSLETSAKERAKKAGRNLSNYLQWLIQQDVEKGEQREVGA